MTKYIPNMYIEPKKNIFLYKQYFSAGTNYIKMKIEPTLDLASEG